MKVLVAVVLLSVVSVSPLFAQGRDRSLERISLALQQPPLIVDSGEPVQSVEPARFGIFTLLPPTGRGEVIRVSVPVGELVMRAFRGVTTAKHRRQEAAARRRVAAELKSFAAQHRAHQR